MPGSNFSQPLAQARGGAATDWAAVAGGAEVRLIAAASLSRGLNLDLGVMGMASVDASLSKFLTAEVTGEGHASASLRAQVQVPTNLFKEIGLAVRLEAIAELAAGVEASLGLSVGDFVALVEQSPGMQGLPSALFRVFLEETTLSVGVYAKAALTAQAFAHLVLTGTALGDPARGIQPGFNIVGSMGAGLKAGAGFRVFARFGIDDFRRLYGRSVDLLVDEAVAAARPFLAGDANAETRRLLEVARPTAKIGLRLAYELGECLATTAPATDAAGGQAVALRAGQVILEEAQRYLLESLGELAVRECTAFLRDSQGRATWDATSAERRALADTVRGRPARPFDGSAGAQTFWVSLVTGALDLGVVLTGAANDRLTRGAAIAWAATALTSIASARVVDVQASASVIGVPPLRERRAFTGPLPHQPPARVDQHIRARLQALGQAAPGQLDLDHLVVFLTDTAVLDVLRDGVPGADEFLAPFAAGLGGGASAAARTLLLNIGAIDTGTGLDNQRTLELLVNAVRVLYEEQIEARLLPPLRQQVAISADTLMAFDEVMVPSLRFAVTTAFDQALRWNGSSVSGDQLTEALSGVVMRVLGRGLVAATDVLLAATQAEVGRILAETADALDQPGGVIDALMAQVPGGTAAGDVADIVAEGLRVAADVFGPLPAARRAAIRRLLYQIIDTLPPDADEAFLAELARADFMPRTVPMQQLAGELAAVAIERFLLFVERFLLRLAAKALEELLEFFQAAADAVAAWANSVIAGLQALGEALAQLAAEITALIVAVAEAFADAGQRLVAALATLGTSPGRTAFKNGLFDETVGAALGLLDDNAVVSGVLALAGRERVENALRAAFTVALNHAIVDRVLDVIGDAAARLDDLVDDVRGLDPDLPLAPQIGELVLDRIELAIADMLGSHAVVPVGFRVTWSEYDILAGKWRTKSATIDLGEVRVDLDPVLDVVRDVAASLGAFQTALEQCAAAFAAGFRQERVLDAKTNERAHVQSEHDGLASHADEARTTGRDMTILSPTLAQVVDQPSQLAIDLEGALPSMLTEGADVPRRIIVRLNDRDVPLSSFQVDVRPPPPAALPGTRSDGRGRQGAGYAAFAQGVHRASDGRRSTSARLPITHDERGRPGPAHRDRRAGGGAGLRVEREFGRGLGKPGAPSALPAPAIAGAGLRLSRPLLPGDLVLGMNTLVVALVAPGGEPVRQCVTFFAQPAGSAAQRPAPPNTTRPGRDGKVVALPGKRAHRPDLLGRAKPGSAKLPKGGRPRATLQPRATPAGLALPSRADRKASLAQLIATVTTATFDPLRSARRVSPTVAARPAASAPAILVVPRVSAPQVTPARVAVRRRAGPSTGPGSVFSPPAPPAGPIRTRES